MSTRKTMVFKFDFSLIAKVNKSLMLLHFTDKAIDRNVTNNSKLYNRKLNIITISRYELLFSIFLLFTADLRFDSFK